MPHFNVVTLFKKYWYLLVLVLIAAAVGAHHAYESDLEPLDLLRRFGYPIIIGWTFLEGETIVILAGAFSRRLALRPELIALCAFCGSFASDQLMFSLGKYKGPVLLKNFPRLGSNIDRAARLFKKYDTALILGFRFVYGVRNVTPILLGISGVSHKKFFFLNFIGAAVWAVSFTYGGLYLGKAFIKAVEHFGKGFLALLLLLLLVGGVIWLVRSRSTVRHHESVTAGHVGHEQPGGPAQSGQTAQPAQPEQSGQPVQPETALEAECLEDKNA